MQRSMTFTSAVVLSGLTAIAVVVSAACNPDSQNQQATSPSAYPQQGGYYPQQQQPYPQQQAYPQQYPQQQQPYPQQQQPYPQQPQQPAYPPGPAAPTASAAGTMATPGPLAPACQADSACMTHRCNTQYQKCAMPCVSTAADCAPGNNCTMGVCTPAMGGH